MQLVMWSDMSTERPTSQRRLVISALQREQSAAPPAGACAGGWSESGRHAVP